MFYRIVTNNWNISSLFDTEDSRVRTNSNKKKVENTRFEIRWFLLVMRVRNNIDKYIVP